MKWKSALTVEEAVLVVMEYKEGEFAYISLEKEIITNWERREIDEKVSAWFYESIDIYEALMADAYAEVDDRSAVTQLEVHQLVYAEHKEDHGMFPVIYNRIDIKKTTFTKQSLALWFYNTAFGNSTEAEAIRMAKIIYPRFTPKPEATTSDTIKKIKEENALHVSILEQQNKDLIKENEKLIQEIENNRTSNLDDSKNYPPGINNAIQVFNECWSHLPYDMKAPSKGDLIGFIKARLGQPEGSTIKALLNLSTPYKNAYGGMQEKERVKPWKQKNLN